MHIYQQVHGDYSEDAGVKTERHAEEEVPEETEVIGFVIKRYGGGRRVWRGKWGPLVAESGEGGGWEEEVRWCDGGGRVEWKMKKRLS
ncbi:hypothetical protein Tco_1269113 [Tanacetum coccineum]